MATRVDPQLFRTRVEDHCKVLLGCSDGDIYHIGISRPKLRHIQSRWAMLRSLQKLVMPPRPWADGTFAEREPDDRPVIRSAEPRAGDGGCTDGEGEKGRALHLGVDLAKSLGKILFRERRDEECQRLGNWEA